MNGTPLEFEVIEDVVVIYSEERSNTTLSRIDASLRLASRDLRGFGQRRGLIRDLSKTFEGVSHDGFRSTGFYPIGERVLERAVQQVRRTAT